MNTKPGEHAGLLARIFIRAALAVLVLTSLAWSGHILSTEAPWASGMTTVVNVLSDGRPVVLSDIEPFVGEARAGVATPDCHAERARQGASLLIRLYELKYAGPDKSEAAAALADARRGIVRSLTCDPLQPNLWFMLSRLTAEQDGLTPDVLASLRISYRLGRHEGWIARRRFAFAIGLLPIVDDELRHWIADEGRNLLSSLFWRDVLTAYFSSPAFAQEFIEELQSGLKQTDRDRFADNRDRMRDGYFRPRVRK